MLISAFNFTINIVRHCAPILFLIGRALSGSLLQLHGVLGMDGW
jgi:hypothetical protein